MGPMLVAVAIVLTWLVVMVAVVGMCRAAQIGDALGPPMRARRRHRAVHRRFPHPHERLGARRARTSA